MLKGIDIRQRFDFISSHDTGEPKTVFVLRPLSSLEMTIFSTLNENNPKEAFSFYLENSIVEIRNFDTKDVKEAVSMLDPVTLGELITKSNELNRVTRQEAKNS